MEKTLITFTFTLALGVILTACGHTENASSHSSDGNTIRGVVNGMPVRDGGHPSGGRVIPNPGSTGGYGRPK